MNCNKYKNTNDAYWPKKYKIFNVNVSATTYDEELELVIKAAKLHKSTCISHLAVHGLICGTFSHELKDVLNEFEIVSPDGMPIKGALNLLYKTNLSENVRGPEFTLRACEGAAKNNVKVFLYGSDKETITNLQNNLKKKYPNLGIVGCEPSLFRPLTKEEKNELITKINGSKAGIVLIGLGCPLQEKFAYQLKNHVHSVMICVGAAFDFHAKKKKMAPEWMRRNYIEWFYRLCQEPKRLWKRYLFTNSMFLILLSLQYVRSIIKYKEL